MSSSLPPAAPDSTRIIWANVVIGAVLMLGTLPGRTQGLALITEPLLQELQMDRVTYASINLWATLLGAAACIPAGWALDRFGLRWPSAVIVLALGATVQAMSQHPGGVMLLFLWILLTRAIGQSALSVASITTAGKGAGHLIGQAMGVYSVLFMVLYAASFPLIGWLVREDGWRPAWHFVSLGLLLVIAPLTLQCIREPGRASTLSPAETLQGATLGEALRTRVFWVFAGATSLLNLVLSGLGLFNEAVLAEAGFDQKNFTHFLAAMTGFTLLGQGLCGWLSRRIGLPVLLGLASFLYAGALAMLTHIRTLPQLWALAGLIGVAVGFITVIFFAIWSQAFGRAHLGRIQGAAQMLTVLSSAAGPLAFALCHRQFGSYAPALYCLAPSVALMGVIACFTRVEGREAMPD